MKTIHDRAMQLLALGKSLDQTKRILYEEYGERVSSDLLNHLNTLPEPPRRGRPRGTNPEARVRNLIKDLISIDFSYEEIEKHLRKLL